MKVGQLVMLVGTDGYMPPMGAVGEIVEPFDGEDYGILFPRHPCPVESPEWYVPPRMLMPIEDRGWLATLCEHKVRLQRIEESFERCAECGAAMPDHASWGAA